MCVSGESLGRARFLPHAARAATAKYPLLCTPRPGLSRGDLLLVELGRALGHSPVPVNKLPLPILQACCLPALTHPPPGRFSPFLIFFSSFIYTGKAWSRPEGGQSGSPPAGGRPRSIPQQAAREGWEEMPFFDRAVCSTALFLSDGTGACTGPSRWWCKCCSLCAGGRHRLLGCFSICFRPVNSCVLTFVLTQLAWRHAHRRAHRYFERRLLLLGQPKLAGTARGHPMSGAKQSPSNLEGS